MRDSSEDDEDNWERETKKQTISPNRESQNLETTNRIFSLVKQLES